jgi:hypothetical protein
MNIDSNHPMAKTLIVADSNGTEVPNVVSVDTETEEVVALITGAKIGQEKTTLQTLVSERVTTDASKGLLERTEITVTIPLKGLRFFNRETLKEVTKADLQKALDDAQAAVDAVGSSAVTPGAAAELIANAAKPKRERKAKTAPATPPQS